MGRPWEISSKAWKKCMELFPMWLAERGGIVVYENHMLDSSHRGDRSYMPARFLAEEDDELHDAPDQHFPDGVGLPSLRQQKVDHVVLEEFLDVQDLIRACFVREKEMDDG